MDSYRPRGRWNIDYRAASEPDEVCVYVKNKETFGPTERFKWHDHYLQTGQMMGMWVLGREATSLNRQNTIFKSVHARYRVVASVVFPPLIKVDAETGQCLYDRACLALARLVRAVSGEGAPSNRVGEYELPVPPKITLTILVHQANHSAVDTVCQDVAIDIDSCDLDAVIFDVMNSLKSVENHAFHASRALQKDDTAYNLYADGCLHDVLSTAMQRVPRQHNDANSIFTIITDFAHTAHLGGGSVMRMRETLAAYDAQLTLVNVGGTPVTRFPSLRALVSAVNGIVIDWSFFEQAGVATEYGPLDGTIGQPELISAGYFGNRMGPPQAAASPARPGSPTPRPDAAGPRSGKTLDVLARLRRTLLVRFINVLGEEANIGLPWPIDASSHCRSSPQAMNKEALSRTVVAKWEVKNIADTTTLFEMRVREGWTVVLPWKSCAAMSWATGRARYPAVTLVYEVNGQMGTMDIQYEVSVLACGPRELVTSYECLDDDTKRDVRPREVARLREFVSELQRRDNLLCAMLKDTEGVGSAAGARSVNDLVLQHSSLQGCTTAWHFASRCFSYSAILQDPTGGTASVGDGTTIEFSDRIENRVFDINLFVQALTQKWPSPVVGASHFDTGRPGQSVHTAPCVRRLASGGVVTSQFFLQTAGGYPRLPVCVEVRVSFFNVAYPDVMLRDLRRYLSTANLAQTLHGRVGSGIGAYAMPGMIGSRAISRSSVSVSMVREEVASVTRDIVNKATEQRLLDVYPNDTTDTDAYVSDSLMYHNATHNPSQNRRAAQSAGAAGSGGPGQRDSRQHHPVNHISPLSHHLTHRTWRWVLPESRMNLAHTVLHVLIQVRLQAGFITVQMRETDVVMYKGGGQAMVLYSLSISDAAVEARLWVEQSDRGVKNAGGGIAFPKAARMEFIERMYREHSLVLHAFATFGHLSSAVENNIPRIQHGKIRSCEPPTSMVNPAAPSRVVIGGRRVLVGGRYCSCPVCAGEGDAERIAKPVLGGKPPAGGAATSASGAGVEKSVCATDAYRFTPAPCAPSTVPLWKRLLNPEAAEAEELTLPQIDLLLRAGSSRMLCFPCLTDSSAPLDCETSLDGVPPDNAKVEKEDPVRALIDILLQSSGQAPQTLLQDVLARAKAVLNSTDTSSVVKRAKAILSSEPWKVKGTPIDLSLPAHRQMLAVELLSFPDSAASKRLCSALYSRVVNCVKLLCTTQVDVSASDFPGGQYPRTLVPPGSPLASAASLHCFVKSSDPRGGRPSDAPVTSLVITILATRETAKPVALTLDGEAKPTLAYVGYVHEVSLDQLSWDALAEDAERSTPPRQDSADDGLLEKDGTMTSSWDGMESATKSPQSGLETFKKFLETSSRMMFAFSVYRALQCNDVVSLEDIKRGQSACVDYASEVEITDLVQIHTAHGRAVPHDQVNQVLKNALDKNFGHMLGTECHYYFRGVPEVRTNEAWSASGTGSMPKREKRQSIMTNRVSASSAGRVGITRPAMTPSIASSAAAPPSVGHSHRIGVEMRKPMGVLDHDPLTTSNVALIPHAAGLPSDNTAGTASQSLNPNHIYPDDLTSFPSHSPDSLRSSSEGDADEVDSPRELGDEQQSRLAHSACYDTESEGGGSIHTSTPVETEPQPTSGGDDLPLFLMMQVTYHVREMRATWRKGKPAESLGIYTMPIFHSVLNPSDPVTLPASHGTLVRATLSLIASSIPSQYFELSEHGFLPTRREAVRKCVKECPAMDTFRRFSPTRDQYIETDHQTKMGPRDAAGNSHHFFPTGPKKLMERTIRRVQAEVHKAQLTWQLAKPMPDAPSILVHRIESLCPRNWSKATLKMLLIGNPLKKPDLARFFREWLAESPELLIRNQSENVDEDGSTTFILSFQLSAGEKAAVTAAFVVAACAAARFGTAGAGAHTQDAMMRYHPSYFTAYREEPPPLTHWMLLKIKEKVRPVFVSTGGVHGLGLDRACLKMRVWLFGPGYPHPSEQLHLLQRLDTALKHVQRCVNQALLLEECHALSPHFISDLLVPPDRTAALRYVAVKAAVAVVASTILCTTCGHEPPPRRRQSCQQNQAASLVQNPAGHGPNPPGPPSSITKHTRSRAPASGYGGRSASIAGESIHSVSVAATVPVPVPVPSLREASPSVTGLLVSRDVMPYEPWERWGGLACEPYVVAELDLGSCTVAADVDLCFFHVWSNWQCDNRLRTYLWRGGKDDVYYFQFKLTELVNYLPYRLVGVAGAAAAAVAVVRVHEKNVERQRLHLEQVQHAVVCVGALAAGVAASRACGWQPAQAPDAAEPSAKDGGRKAQGEVPAADAKGAPRGEDASGDAGTEKAADASTEVLGTPTSQLLKEPPLSSSVKGAAAAAAATANKAPLAHDLEQGRLRAEMRIYSVRPPPEEITAPLAAEFRSCMRKASMMALGKHIQKTGGKLRPEDLDELQTRAERRYSLTSLVPADLVPDCGRLLDYCRTYMKKSGTVVQITGDSLTSEPPPHFIYLGRGLTNADKRDQGDQWLGCVNLSLVRVALPGADDGAAASPREWDTLLDTQESSGCGVTTLACTRANNTPASSPGSPTAKLGSPATTAAGAQYKKAACAVARQTSPEMAMRVVRKPVAKPQAALPPAAVQPQVGSASGATDSRSPSRPSTPLQADVMPPRLDSSILQQAIHGSGQPTPVPLAPKYRITEASPRAEREEEVPVDLDALAPGHAIGIRFLLWVSGDTKELESAITQLRETLQLCVVQVYCECSLENRLPPLTQLRQSDVERVKALCTKAQEKALNNRRKPTERHWDSSCGVRTFTGTVNPESAAGLAQNIATMIHELDSKLAGESVVGRNHSMQPVVFYAARRMSSGLWGRAEADASLLSLTSVSSPESAAADDRRGDSASPGAASKAPSQGFPCEDELYPLPDFAPATLRHLATRLPVPPLDYYVVAGGDAPGASSASATLCKNWSTLHAAQFPNPEAAPPPVPQCVLRYYDGADAEVRPSLCAVRVTSEGIDLISYNLRADFVKGIEHGISSIATEVQRRAVALSCMLHQKMGIFLPGPSLYPQESMLCRDPSVPTPEMDMGTLDDILNTSSYTKETLDNAFLEATGRAKGGAGPGARSRMAQIGMFPPHGPHSAHYRRLAGPTWTTQPAPAPTTPGKTSVPVGGMLFGVGGLSARVATKCRGAYAAQIMSGKLSGNLVRHVVTFKAMVAVGQQTAQQLKATNALKKDIAEFREAVKAQWVGDRPGYVLQCVPSQAPSSLAPAILPVVPVVALAVVAVTAGAGLARRDQVVWHVGIAGVGAAACAAVVAAAEVLPLRRKVDSQHSKVVSVRFHNEVPTEGPPPQHLGGAVGSSPSQQAYLSRARTRSFVANFIRMRQSSRQYHCQRVPFLLNKSRRQLLLNARYGPGAGGGTAAAGSTANTGALSTAAAATAAQLLPACRKEIAAWKDLLARFMWDYFQYLTLESERHCGVSWVTACVNVDELLSNPPHDKRISADAVQDLDVLRQFVTNVGIGAGLQVADKFVTCPNMSFFAVAEVTDGGLLLLDLHVIDSCFGLELYLCDVADARPKLMSGLKRPLPPLATPSATPSGSLCRTVAHLRSWLHMNSCFYDFQLAYIHQSLRLQDRGQLRCRPEIDWLGVLQDSVQLYERPPLYSVNHLGCKRVTIAVPKEILSEINASENPPTSDLTADAYKRALGKFFAYVCKQAGTTLQQEDGKVALLMHQDNTSQFFAGDCRYYECDGVAVTRLDCLGSNQLELPLDVYLMCAVSTSITREVRRCESLESFKAAAYEYFRSEVKRQCDDAVRNYRVHCLWKRMQQRKITPQEVAALLDGQSPTCAPAVTKQEVIPTMDPASLTCLQSIDYDTWLAVCSACGRAYEAARAAGSTGTLPKIIVYSPEEMAGRKVEGAATGGVAPLDPIHWIFVPSRAARATSLGAQATPVHPRIIVVVFLPDKKTVKVSWCSPQARSERPVKDAPSPTLEPEDSKFFANWVNVITETLWQVAC